MASLMEELIITLDQEKNEYKKLLALSLAKTPVIISADLDSLAKITDDEQAVVNVISALDKKRDTYMKDIANVINKDVNTLKISNIITMLQGRPQEQNKLAAIYDELTDVLAQMKRVNEQNKQLIESSLEMIEFDMNLVQASKAAPQTANYSRGAYSTGDVIGMNASGFDSKS